MPTTRSTEARQAPPPRGADRARRRRLKDKLADVLFGPEGPQRFSTKVSMTGLMTYVPCMLLVVYCGWAGLTPPQFVVPVVLAMVLTVAGFYAALRSGWSRRFADAGLILPQMLASITWDAIGYVLMGEAHAGMLMPAALTVTYGVFALHGRGAYAVQAYAIVLIGATMATMCVVDPAMFPVREAVLLYASFVVTILMLGWTGHQIAQLRQRERETRAELGATLEQIQQRATHDSLTGLHNRRHMQSALAHHLARAERDGMPLTIALLDIDHFKQVNDQHGHAAGDAVLAAFARVAEAALPPTELIGRWGGEEFLVLSTRGLSSEELRAQIDQVRAALLQQPIDVPTGRLCIDFSAGVASHQPGTPLPALIDSADQALYAAKQGGRGRSVIAGVQALPASGHTQIRSVVHASA
ncbi:GGDEF domain-containing protein [Piscinibacter sp. HJYY11]|uniref:GGDEF domain-containing protein n=1 Tax=Piscinibacter sp. HJYY11 TaxID=2801333 RepID=UPI00191D86B6|nr:GGDEF domain-containing protein [Piscinibacter sp. HJYY11]MBL0726480.1 GGDEF domain-containing protein [Piscinibacter sp. HJYY11]